MDVYFLDTETTGIEAGRLIQLAYKKRGDAEGIVEYYKPPVPIEIEAMAVHHITEKKVANKPSFADSGMREKLSGLLNGSVLVAHTAKFDRMILETEGVTIGDYICTMKIAQTMYDFPSYKLQYLRYLWGIDDDDAVAHDAEGDVAILEKVFEHLVEEYKKQNGLSEEETITKFIEISKNPILLKRMLFGKLVGKTFAEIKATDPSYLAWLGSLADKDEDFIYTVNYYLKN